MKRNFFFTVFLVWLFSTPVFAQESGKTAKYTSPFFYENVPVYQILNAPEAYVVIYAKYGAGVGKTVIPKSWTKGNITNPAKLVFRQLPPTLNPYMTVIKKDGEFYKVYLTVPLSRLNSVWGEVPSGTKLEGADKTTLDLQL